MNSKYILIINGEPNSIFSEIFFKALKKEKFKNPIILISSKKIINEKNFSQAALIYSISDTSKEGGKLDWIKETVLSEKIKKELNNIETGMFTNPILVPGGFLLLHIEETRISKVPINKDNEIKKIINQQTNEQLNRYSNIYFKKIKKNILINEF